MNRSLASSWALTSTHTRTHARTGHPIEVPTRRACRTSRPKAPACPSTPGLLRDCLPHSLLACVLPFAFWRPAACLGPPGMIVFSSILAHKRDKKRDSSGSLLAPLHPGLHPAIPFQSRRRDENDRAPSDMTGQKESISYCCPRQHTNCGTPQRQSPWLVALQEWGSGYTKPPSQELRCSQCLHLACRLTMQRQATRLSHARMGPRATPGRPGIRGSRRRHAAARRSNQPILHVVTGKRLPLLLLGAKRPSRYCLSRLGWLTLAAPVPSPCQIVWMVSHFLRII